MRLVQVAKDFFFQVLEEHCILLPKSRCSGIVAAPVVAVAAPMAVIVLLHVVDLVDARLLIIVDFGVPVLLVLSP
jgi:hypothetical protein